MLLKKEVKQHLHPVILGKLCTQFKDLYNMGGNEDSVGCGFFNINIVVSS